MTVKLEHTMGSFLPPRGGWLSKLAAGLILVAAIVAGVALSAFFFGFFLVLAAIAGLWLWWQQWRLRRRMHRRAQQTDRHIIQGEYEVVEDDAKTTRRSARHDAPRR